jgi:hypothetical protein
VRPAQLLLRLFLAAAFAACGTSAAGAAGSGSDAAPGPPVDASSADASDGASDDGPSDTQPSGAIDASATFAANERLVTIPTRPGVTLSFDVVTPASAPSHAVILLAGSNGKLGLTSTGMAPGAAQNFVVRTRQAYAAAGFAAAVPDTPSDHPQGTTGQFRSSQADALDMQALVAWLKGQWSVPVWMVATSRGTISAANAAARSKTDAPDGVVLTSCVTVDPGDAGQDSLANVDLAAIRAPVEAIDHRQDGCPASPFANAQAMATARGWPFVPVDGGVEAPDADPCGPLSHHGFDGLDAQVVADVVAFVTQH